MLEHQAVSSSCTHHGHALEFSSDTRHLQFSSFTFDGCITEIFTTLVFGGCVTMPSDSDRLSNLTGAINDLQVNTMFLTVAVSRLIEPRAVPGVKRLAFGGELITSADYERWQLPGRRVVGVYGPTECCVYCAAHDSANGTDSGLLGKSMSSVCWIVDADNHQRLAPLGAVGELVVEGPTLAQGYLNDRDKTYTSFLDSPAWLLQENPSSSGRCSRMYKTGDLVQYTSVCDGSMLYIGRKDTYVSCSHDIT